jgi:SAM-dependent methyltransferase
MRPVVRAFVEAVAKSLPGAGHVLEIGAYRVAGQGELADLRALFPGRPYVGLDMRPGPGVDVVGDAAALPFPDASQGTVLCLETLEHVFDLRTALAQIERVLAPGGVFVASTPFHFHLHAHPDDYWRLSPSAWARLLEGYALRMVGAVGPASRPHTVLALGVKAPAPEGVARAVAAAFEGLRQRLAALPGPGWLARARGLLLTKGEREARAEVHTLRIVPGG